MSVSNGSTTLTSYQYDALGRRVVETESGTTTAVYFDGENVIEQRVAGTATTQYVWNPQGANMLVEMDVTASGGSALSERLYVQQDPNNNVTALVSTSGVVVERYDYTAYGVQTIYDGTWSTTRSTSAYGMQYGFQGMRLDLVTGLYHSYTRDYSPEMQVWVQQDPIGLAGGSIVETQMGGR